MLSTGLCETSFAYTDNANKSLKGLKFLSLLGGTIGVVLNSCGYLPIFSNSFLISSALSFIFSALATSAVGQLFFIYGIEYNKIPEDLLNDALISDQCKTELANYYNIKPIKEVNDIIGDIKLPLTNNFLNNTRCINAALLGSSAILLLTGDYIIAIGGAVIAWKSIEIYNRNLNNNNPELIEILAR